MVVQLLLENDKVEGIRYYDAYRKNGGYRAAEKAFKMSQADIVEEVKKSGLRGRGGAGSRAGQGRRVSGAWGAAGVGGGGECIKGGVSV